MAGQDFTHFTSSGHPVMVDVSNKADTARTAVAAVLVDMKDETRGRIEAATIAKGDVQTVASLAGIMAAKRTQDLIPLCHPLPLTHVSVVPEWVESEAEGRALLQLTATVKTTHKTGVEMEALTACSVAALTVYDMCKAVDKTMVILELKLLEKHGGQSSI